MDTAVFDYVRGKIKSGFSACDWTDSVGKKFEENIVPEIEKTVCRTADSMEDLQKCCQRAEELLRETGELLNRIKKESDG